MTTSGASYEDVAARDPPFDGSGCAVAPRSARHRPALRRAAGSALAVAQPDEPHRTGVVRRRCGERVGDGGVDEFRRHRCVREPADRSAQQLGLAPTLRSPRRCRARTGRRRRARQVPRRPPSSSNRIAAHHRHRDRGEFALHESAAAATSSATATSVTCSSLPAVDGARVAVQYRQARAPDRRVGLPVAPGAPIVSVMTTATSTPSRSLSPAGSVAALASGSIGNRASSVGETLEPSTPEAACTIPSRFSVMKRSPLAGEHPHRLALDQFAARGVALLGIGWRGDDPPLRLGHDLARDDDDVAVAQPRRGARSVRRCRRRAGTSGRSRTGRILQSVDRAVVDHVWISASSIALRAISAVVGGSVMSSGTARTARPSISARSEVWISQPSRMPVPLRAP